jgi:cell wall-associated NlpC family hydrolase
MVLALPAGAVAPAAPAPATPAPAPTDQSGSIQIVLDYALAQVGKPYRFYSAGPDAFDCSGLTKAAYAQVGVTLTHQSAAQAQQGVLVSFMNEPLHPGDLVFQDTNGDDVVNHVGIVIDSGRWIHATKPGDGVRIAPLPALTKMFAVRRVVAAS